MFDDIRERGLIQPIVLQLGENGSFKLIAGGRRLSALSKLGYDSVHHGVTCDPSRPGFVWTQELPEDVRLELEVTENVSRKSMTWQEICLSVARVHDSRVKKSNTAGSNWIVEQTGKLLGTSKATATYSILVARALSSGDKDISSCDNMTEAVKILLKRKQVEAELKKEVFRKAAQEQAKRDRMSKLSAKLTTERKAAKSEAKPRSSDDLVDAPASAEAVSDSAEPVSYAILDDTLAESVAYDTACSIVTCCDSLTVGMPGIPAESIDHVYTDIPYGIDMDNLNIDNIEVTAAEHDRDSNIKDFQRFLSGAYRIIKPGGWCVFWFDVEHFSTLLEIARKVGFSCQRWPLHWHKNVCKNEVPRYNVTKNYESVMLCRKQHATLNSPVSSSIFTGLWDKDERSSYVHPFAKPLSAHTELLRMFAKPGDNVVDPYCGEGSGVLAMLKFGLSVTAFDLMPDHVRRAREHVVKYLCTP